MYREFALVTRRPYCPRRPKKALFYHAKPRPHGFDCEAWRGKTKLFWSPGTIWPPCDKGDIAPVMPLICSLNLLFGGNPVSAVNVVFLNSLTMELHLKTVRIPAHKGSLNTSWLNSLWIDTQGVASIKELVLTEDRRTNLRMWEHILENEE